LFYFLQVLTDMAQSIGSKPWWNINTGYYQTAGGQKTSVQSTVNYRGYTTVPNNGLCWQVRARMQSGRYWHDLFVEANCVPCMCAHAISPIPSGMLDDD